MDDVLLLVANVLLASPTPENLLAFVKLQATHRGVWAHFKHDRALWTRLQALLPKWSLPEHLGLRRRVITGVKLLLAKCIVATFGAFENELTLARRAYEVAISGQTRRSQCFETAYAEILRLADEDKS